MAERESAAEPADDADVAPAPDVGPDATAVALALGQSLHGSKLPPEAAAYLAEQTRLARLQSEHLHEQRALQVEHLADQSRHLRLRHLDQRLSVALKLMTAVVGLVAALAVGLMAWQAHEDHGVVIEAFSVPPDLAQRGLTGKVVASQVLDSLKTMQARAVSQRPAESYQNNWGEDIKVEIPETGVSIGELNRYLRQWLGHETRIGGEVYRSGSGLAVTARAGETPGKTVQGSDADLDKLIGKAAEGVYAEIQPYRYATFLSSTGRTEEGLKAFGELAQTGPLEERGWAYVALGGAAYAQGDMEAMIRDARAADAFKPPLLQSCSLVAVAETGLGHEEAALHEWKRCNDLLRSRPLADVPASGVAGLINLQEGNIGDLLGDFAQRDRLRTGSLGMVEGQARFDITTPFKIRSLIGRHDVAGAERLIEGLKGSGADLSQYRGAEALVLDDWRGVVRLAEPVMERGALPNGAASPIGGSMDVLIRNAGPPLALSYAMIGRRAEAEALASRFPRDCDACLIARGQIAAAERDWAAADRWFAAAEAQAPSIPLADLAWGQALLDKGDPDGAIAKLAAANRKGPKFADPLEGWGEALMRKGDFAGAVAKFAEADRSAPRWGRNHRMWGEALMLSGRYGEARAQYEAAAGLDLGPADRAAVKLLLARTASGPLHG
jgi:tetratricopeptide (TPR) repeat protein